MPLKKKIRKAVALVAVFFFVFQTFALPPLYASDAGTADFHGGTNIGTASPRSENGNPENPGDPDNNDCTAGQPVSLLTGEETHTKTDLRIPGRLDLTVIHTYKSQRNYNGRWGYGWFLNYDIKIKKLENDNLLLVSGKGTKEEYVRNSAGGYDSPSGFYDTVRENPDGSYTRSLKNGTTYYFDVNGCLSFIEDRNGNRLIFTYDSAGKLPINGRSEFFVSRETGVIAYDYKLTTISDYSGRELAFDYDGDGRLTKITDPGNREVVYEYDDNNNLVRAYDPADPATPLAARDYYAYAYDGDHNLVSVTNPNGIMYLVNEYDDRNRVARQTYNGATSVFSYDPENHAASLTRADGSVISYELSACCGNPTKVVRDAGPGRLNLTRTYTYDDDMNMTSETDPRGNTAFYEYDDRGNVITVTDPEGGITRFEYEPTYNQVTKITDALERETNFEYDRGNLIQITDALGNRTHFFYDTPYHDLTTVVNAGDHVTRFDYDAYGRISTITDALNNTVGMTYDVLGNLLSVTDQNGRTTEFSYTAKNELRQITDALGNITGFTYDRNGNRRTITDALGNTTTFAYDANDRLVTVTNALNHAIAFGYDIHGNLTSAGDAEGNTTTYQYDTWDRLVRVVDAMNRATAYAYDANGNLEAITDAMGNTTTYQYDALNRVTRTTFPDASFEVRAYDSVGNLVSKRNRSGSTISHVYDALNRLRTVTYPGNVRFSYAYDNLGRLVSATNNTNAVQYAYDALNRVTGATQDGRTVGYQYDAAGNRTRLTYPDGSFVTYVHDALNRLDQIRNNSGQVIADYAYDEASRRTGADLLNGTRAAYAYDTANRLTTLTNRTGASQVISDYAYGYDRAGNRTSMTKNGGLHSYTYDRVYQLTGVDYPAGWPFADTAFNYDAAGNRTTVGATTYTANALNQYTTVGTAAYSYDGNGNLTSDGTNSYSYDDENRLVRATTASDTVTLAYDAFGRRTRKTNASGTVSYVYDGDQVIAEYGASGNLLRKFVYGTGIDEPIEMETGGNRYFYHFDGLGSVTEMTDSGGTVVEKYAYDVYGKLRITDGSDNVLTESSIGNPYYFTGRRHDSDTGLYYYRARYYSAELGRFLQVDPVGYLGSMNLYHYCLNNPVNFVDPSGMTLECPESPPIGNSNWTVYKGDSWWFHCDYENVFHENRVPTPDNPIAECAYDEMGNLVDDDHPFSGCEGTPNQYPSDDWLNHTFNDSGGIRENGEDALRDSLLHNILRHTPFFDIGNALHQVNKSRPSRRR